VYDVFSSRQIVCRYADLLKETPTTLCITSKNLRQCPAGGFSFWGTQPAGAISAAAVSADPKAWTAHRCAPMGRGGNRGLAPWKLPPSRRSCAGIDFRFEGIEWEAGPVVDADAWIVTAFDAFSDHRTVQSAKPSSRDASKRRIWANCSVIECYSCWLNDARRAP
jgi:hypothetical protein